MERRLVIVTGLSGSGKSLAGRCLEDLGFFCVDNLPVALIPPFHDLVRRAEQILRAALVVDVREKSFLTSFPARLRELREKRAPVELLFFECSDEVLKRRFSETRRPHPMADERGTLEAAIRAERLALASLREGADRIIDTTRFSAHELRNFLSNAYGTGGDAPGPNVNLVSFGFKYGLPTEADLLFDVRFLPNPYFVEGLRSLDGRTQEVREFLQGTAETPVFLGHLESFVDYLLPLYAKEGKTYLSIAIGCTGGKHRSVMVTEALSAHLRSQGVRASVTHRDVGIE